MEYYLALQHLQEILDMKMSALEWMMKEFPEIRERDEMRKIIGRYGLSGQQQVSTIAGNLSSSSKWFWLWKTHFIDS